MGHLINPVSIRLGISNFSNFNWSLNNKYNYSYMNKNNLTFTKFLNWILKSKKFNKKNVIFSHYNIYINNNNTTYVNLFFYNPDLEENRFKDLNLKKSLNFIKNNEKKKVYSTLYKLLINNIFTHLYWYIINNFWKKFLKNVFLNKIKYIIRIHNLDLENVSAKVITTYLSSRLINKHRLNYTIKPVLRDLHLRLKEKRILGYKILCAGRFTRRQIAEHNWYKKGSVTNNNFLSFIDYSQVKIRLKYGVCGIKVWINYGDKQKSAITKFYKLVSPISISSFKKVNNNSFLFKNTAWDFLLLKYKNFKFNSKDYYSFLKFKFSKNMYNFHFLNLIKEISYLIKNKRLANKIIKLVFLQYFNFKYSSQFVFLKQDFKKFKLNNNIYIYE